MNIIALRQLGCGKTISSFYWWRNRSSQYPATILIQDVAGTRVRHCHVTILLLTIKVTDCSTTLDNNSFSSYCCDSGSECLTYSGSILCNIGGTRRHCLLIWYCLFCVSVWNLAFSLAQYLEPAKGDNPVNWQPERLVCIYSQSK